MTPQEALKVIDKAHDYPCPYGIGGTAWMYIRSCIEKKIPKKVKFADGGNELLCPYCNYDLMGSTNEPEHDPPYCFECGQALDWSDTE